MATTAQRLLAYRKELRDGGLDTDLVNDLVKDAAHEMLTVEGLRVPASNPAIIGTSPTS